MQTNTVARNLKADRAEIAAADIDRTVRMIVNLAIIAIVFASLVLGMLIFILLDLAPGIGLLHGYEYEGVRIAVELVTLFFSASLVGWVILHRRNR